MYEAPIRISIFFLQKLWKHPPVSTCILLPRQLKHTKVFLSQSALIAHGSHWTLSYPVKSRIFLLTQWSYHYPCCPHSVNAADMPWSFLLFPLTPYALFSCSQKHITACLHVSLVCNGAGAVRCWNWNKP